MIADADALFEFKHGADLLRDGYPADAIEYFRSAVQADEQNPYYLSFLGLSIARAHKKWDVALELCETAIRRKADDPQLYLNLAEVYLGASRREDAIRLLDAAMAGIGHGPSSAAEHYGLAQRGGGILPFLSRQHFLNRKLVQMRRRASKHFATYGRSPITTPFHSSHF